MLNCLPIKCQCGLLDFVIMMPAQALEDVVIVDNELHACHMLKRQIADVKHLVGDDQDPSKIRIYKNVCLRNQAKPLEKHLFAVRTSPLWWNFSLFFPTITRNGFSFFLLSLATAFVLTYEKKFLDNTDPHRKTEIYILQSFFVNSIYSKTIDIIRKKYWFSVFKHYYVF